MNKTETKEKLEVLLRLMPDNGNLIRGLVASIEEEARRETYEKLKAKWKTMKTGESFLDGMYSGYANAVGDVLESLSHPSPTQSGVGRKAEEKECKCCYHHKRNGSCICCKPEVKGSLYSTRKGEE